MFPFCFLSTSALCIAPPANTVLTNNVLAERLVQSAKQVPTLPIAFRCGDGVDRSTAGPVHRRMRRQLSKGWRSLPRDYARSTIDWLRSPADELAALMRQSALLKAEAGSARWGVYADVAIADYQLRLFAIASTMEFSDKSATQHSENLLLLLQPIASSYLPIGTTLTLRAQDSLYAEPTLQWASNPIYLFSRVLASRETQFTVEIHLPDARSAVLSPLTLFS